MSTPSPAIFRIEDHSIEKVGDNIVVSIRGHRAGRPNKRLSINASGIRIASAKITSTQKNKFIEHSVMRINYLPTKGEIRIHTVGMLYPGNYEIKLKLSSQNLPSIDKWFS